MTRLAYDDAGQGPAILLLHGFPATRRLWKDVVPLLVAGGFRAIVPDLMGYGDSPDAADVGMANQAGWISGLVDELRLEQVAIAAHDVGTAAAQILAVRSPARVRKLMLMDGVYETEWAMDAVESIRAWDPGQAARLQPVLQRKLRSIRDLLSGYAGEAGGRRLIHAARCLDPRQTEGMTARLRETGIPVRVLWGAEDAYLSLQSVGKPLADALGVPLQVLEGGHFLPLDNPQAVAAAVLEHCG
jgi:pimeloyl-ACP methyl ester carboxylesterase